MDLAITKEIVGGVVAVTLILTCGYVGLKTILAMLAD